MKFAREKIMKVKKNKTKEKKTRILKKIRERSFGGKQKKTMEMTPRCRRLRVYVRKLSAEGM